MEYLLQLSLTYQSVSHRSISGWIYSKIHSGNFVNIQVLYHETHLKASFWHY
jgi:hypothetical protein